MLLFISISSISVVLAVLWLLGGLLYPRPSRYVDLDDVEKQDSIAAARRRWQELPAEDDNASGDHQQEIQQQLLEEIAAANRPPPAGRPPTKDYTTAAVVCLFLLIAPAALYAWVGAPAAWEKQEVASLQTTPATMPDIDEVATRLQAQLAETPNDPQTLYWLARVVAAQGDTAQARSLYARAYQHASHDAEIIAAYADSLLSAPPAAAGEDIGAVLSAGLAIAPAHPILLWLSGVHAENNGDLESAISFWRRAAAALQDAPEQQQELLDHIADAKHQLALQPSQ